MSEIGEINVGDLRLTCGGTGWTVGRRVSWSGSLDHIATGSGPMSSAITAAEAYCERKIREHAETLAALRRLPERGRRLVWEEDEGYFYARWGAAPLIIGFMVRPYGTGFMATWELFARAAKLGMAATLDEAKAACEDWLARWLRDCGVGR